MVKVQLWRLFLFSLPWFPGHYHQVKSTGNRNLAVSLLFGRVDKFTSGEECKNVPLVAKSLDEFDVLWRWSGTGIMDMGRGDDYFFK